MGSNMRLIIILACVVIAAIALFLFLNRTEARSASSATKKSTINIVATPDTPIGFGYKTLWIAVKAPNAQALSDAIGLKDTKAANWQSGFAAAYDYDSHYFFVTPQIDGWVFAIGYGLQELSDKNAKSAWTAMMAGISRKFGEALFFANYRVSDYYAWARFINGNQRRLFAYADGEILFNDGTPYPEEVQLIKSLVDPQNPTSIKEDYWEQEDSPRLNEEFVLTLASKWSVNPKQYDEKDFPVSVGIIGKLF